MTYTKKIEFANFTLNFGDNLAMMDMFEDVVHSSFFNSKHIRSVRGSDYFFIDTQFVKKIGNTGEEFIGITGKLVKNTKLKREQIYRAKDGIIEDHQELESAPTSIFLLILNTHRLIYVKEVPGAPGLPAFGATCSKFLKIEHKNFINRAYEYNREQRKDDNTLERLTKIKLVQKYPYPNLRVTPLTDRQSLRQFIDKFRQINTFMITLLPTNNEEIDNDGFWNELDDTREKIGSKKAKVDFANTQDGLDSEEVYKQSNSATKLANSDVKFRGFDKHGGTLAGNNDDFSLTVDTDDLQKDVSVTGPSLMSEYFHLVESGSIIVPNTPEKVTSKLLKLKKLFSVLL